MRTLRTKDFQRRWAEIFGGEKKCLVSLEERNGVKETFVSREGGACSLRAKWSGMKLEMQRLPRWGLSEDGGAARVSWPSQGHHLTPRAKQHEEKRGYQLHVQPLQWCEIVCFCCLNLLIVISENQKTLVHYCQIVLRTHVNRTSWKCFFLSFCKHHVLTFYHSFATLLI